jgi:hypothetical protein
MFLISRLWDFSCQAIAQDFLKRITAHGLTDIFHIGAHDCRGILEWSNFHVFLSSLLFSMMLLRSRFEAVK